MKISACRTDAAEKVFKRDMPVFSEDTCPGIFGSIVAGRICHCFDLGGPGVVVDAACAASLAAVEAGARALAEGRLDLALAGGVDGRLDPVTYILFCSLGAISAAGSFPFDERADGFVLGEGAGMVLLKRLADAVRTAWPFWLIAVAAIALKLLGRRGHPEAPSFALWLTPEWLLTSVTTYGHYIRTLIFPLGLSPRYAGTVISSPYGAGFLFGAAALIATLAGYLPALRASRTDPAVVLRSA